MARPFRYTEEQLLSEHPKLRAQWCSAENQSRLIEGKFVSQQTKYWWKCEQGHSWQATLSVRLCGSNCPVCSGHKVQKGINDLQTLFPEIAAEWDYEKNEPLEPNQITARSNKRVFWNCIKGHKWSATVSQRTNGSTCPYCANRKLLVGYNDLATRNPALLDEWNYEKNKELTPQTVMAGADRYAWWICKYGHSWKAKISQRNAGSTCPICSNRMLLRGFNDLATCDPTLATEWDYEKNGSISPDQVLFGSRKQYWWKCALGHTYLSTIQMRAEKSGCPYCCGNKVLAGFNDLVTTHPMLAKQWDYDKNQGANPSQVSAGVSRKFWWICPAGHSWEATINSRSNGRGCPYCSSLRVSEGENDLSTMSPRAVDYWDFERNHGLQPNKVSSKSTMSIWWKCADGHHWRAMIRSMSHPACPYCSGVRKRLTKYIT